ncbi:hypothetical protein [Neptunicoccus sediminis]|uniref:hypothetical protein n=1 Tax=Neptunicoccus sediminis TaxID=1892596 RepID=UPI0008460491|nr:hypothetical protein [Neptunicoccus sediminis]
MKFPYSFATKIAGRKEQKNHPCENTCARDPSTPAPRQTASTTRDADWLGTGVLRDEFATKSAAFAYRAAHRHRAMAYQSATAG